MLSGIIFIRKSIFIDSYFLFVHSSFSLSPFSVFRLRLARNYLASARFSHLLLAASSSTRFIRTGEQAPFVAGISFQFLRSCFDARQNAQGKPISRHLSRNGAETILFFIRYELASVVERRKTTGQQLSQRNQVQE